MLWQAVLLGLAPGLALATSSPSDILSGAWHASNITGLSDLYAWVGSYVPFLNYARSALTCFSYYNGTTTLEFIPLIGQTANEPVCQNVHGRTFNAEFESFVAVTERASYNTGHNPVNVLLTLWKPGTNFLAFANTSDTRQDYNDLWAEPSLEWNLESSPLVQNKSRIR